MDPYLWLLVSILAVIVAYRLYKRSKWKTLEPLLPSTYNFGKRRDTFRRTLELLEARGATCLVETGVAREGLGKSKSDGASTIVFGLWARQNGARLVSIDIDPASIKAARIAVDSMELQDVVNLVTSDSVSYLANLESPVDLLYLDSFDYSKHDEEIQQASQQHHLKELKAIESRLHDNSVVLIDDCKLPGGGKGKLVVDYMLKNGWQIDMSRYQIILVRA